MPKSYSEDLRWHTVWQCHLQNKSVGGIARDLYVSPRSVEHWVKLFDVTGNVSPRHRSSHILNEFEELTVLQTLLTSPSTFLHEVLSELFETTWTWIDCSTICRYARRWGMSRQKMTNVALQRSDVKHVEFIAEMM